MSLLSELVTLAVQQRRRFRPRCCTNVDGVPKACYRTRRSAKKSALKYQVVYACPLDRGHGWHLATRRRKYPDMAPSA